MKPPHIILLEPEPLIADDMREELLSVSPDAVVELATSIDAARELVARLERVDLLIASDRSGEFVASPAYERLAGAAEAILLIADPPGGADGAEPVNGNAIHVARSPFTSASLRAELGAITVAGAPLFPRISPA